MKRIQKYLHTVPLILCLMLAGLVLSGQTLKRKVQDKGGELEISRTDSLFLAGHLQDAVDALDESIAGGPDDPVMLFNRGLLERALGAGNGEIWFRRSITADEQCAESWHGLGMALTEKGLLIEGEERLREALDLKSDYAQAYRDVGKNLRMQSRFQEAEKSLKRAIEDLPGSVECYIELARTYLADEKQESALDVLMKEHDRFPSEQVLMELINLFREWGNVDSVSKYADEYLLLFPKGPNKNEVINILKEVAPDKEIQADSTYRNIIYPDGMKLFDPGSVLPEGLRLSYKVKYGFIKLGTLDIDVLEGEYKGIPTWRAQYIARSAKGVPFVSVTDTFRVHFSRDIRNTILLEMRFHESDYTAVEIYEFDYDKGYMYFREVDVTGYYKYIVRPLPPNVFDPSSMIWYAQQLVLSGRSGTVHTAISGSFEKTRINNAGKGENINLAGREWETVRVDGVMKYAGIVGLTGDFVGWFAADGMGWPLFARFKIFFGSVRLFLVSVQPTPVTVESGWTICD